MKYFLGVILFFITMSFNVLKAQEFLIDSLGTVLKKEKNVYKKIDIHIGLARLYSFYSQFNKNAEHLNKAFKLLEKNPWDEALITAIVFKGVNELNLGKGSEVLLSYLLKADEIANRINYDPGKVIVGYHIAEYYNIDKNNPEKGEEKLLDVLNKIDPKKVHYKKLANFYKTLGRSYVKLGEVEKANNSFEKAIFYFEEEEKSPIFFDRINNFSAVSADKALLNKAQTLVHIARLDLKTGAFEKAKKELQKAISIFKSFKAKSDIEAWAKSFLAEVNEAQGNLTEAIKIYKEVIETYEQNNDRGRLIKIHISLGKLFLKTEAFQTAEDNFNYALKTSLDMKDSIQYVRSLSLLGKLNIDRENIEKAASYIEKGLLINNKMNNNPNNFSLLSYLAEVQHKNKKFVSAINSNKDIIQHNNRYGNHRQSIDNYINIVKIFYETNQLDSAFFYSEKAKTNLAKFGSASQKIYLNKVMTNLYEKKKDYKTALNYYKKAVTDSEESYKKEAIALLKNEQVRQNVASIKAQKEAALSRNKIYIVLALVLASLLIISGYLFYRVRKNKKQIEDKNQQLHDLNETKDKFFGIIAHDIRSPIVALDGVGEQMEYYIKNNKTEKLERLTERVDVTAKNLNKLLDNLLTWALLQQGVIPYHPKNINIHEISINVLEMFIENAKAKRIELISKIDPNIEVFADDASLNTILRNLISNAIKFTKPGGVVTLCTEIKDEHVFIKVNDTGTGISAKALSSLFTINKKKSEQGTSGEQGTGLGLNLVKELIELNKGDINVLSTLGRGSVFTITLPIVKA